MRWARGELKVLGRPGPATREFEGKVLLQSGDPSAAVTRYFGPAGKHRAETAKGPGYSPEY